MKRSLLALGSALVLGAAIAQNPIPQSTNNIPITGVTASNSSRGYQPSFAADGKLTTWWSSNRAPQWVRFDLGTIQEVDSIYVTFYAGDKRATRVSLQGSVDGVTWINLLKPVTIQPEAGETRLTFLRQGLRYLRLVGFGNSQNTAVAVIEARVPKATDLTAIESGDYTQPTETTTQPSGTTGSTGSTGGATTPAPEDEQLYATSAYYIDCNGADTNTGRTREQAWRNVSKLAGVTFQAGDGIYFKRGCSWDGQFSINQSGTADNRIVVSAYGDTTLEKPRIRQSSGEVTVQIGGDYVTVRNLFVTIAPTHIPKPRTDAVKCTSQPTGWRVGIQARGDYGIIEKNYVTGMTIGIQATDSALKGRYNLITRNEIVRNTIMSVNTSAIYDDDSGAFAILINSDHNEISYNYTAENFACSEDYPIEGASIEIYRAGWNYIHHNRAMNETTFSELGGKPDDLARDNRYYYNLFVGADVGAQLLVLRGYNSSWGANPGTVFVNNTAYYTNTGIACFDACDTAILEAHGNVITGRTNPAQSEFFAQGINESANVVWRIGGGPSFKNGTVTRHATTVLQDPRHVNPVKASNTGDFSLQSTSPALERADMARVTNFSIGTTTSGIRTYSITTDLEGTTIPVGSKLDSGALERK